MVQDQLAEGSPKHKIYFSLSGPKPTSWKLFQKRWLFSYIVEDMVEDQPAIACSKGWLFLILSKTNQPKAVQRFMDFFLYGRRPTSRRLFKRKYGYFSHMVEDQPAEGSSKGNMAIFLTWLKDQPTLRLCNHCYTTI